MPSFSSSLLDAIYHSIDEPSTVHRRRDNAEGEVESLRRAILIEKWMENHSTPGHVPSNSGSSTDSIMFSSSETDSSSASRSTPRSLISNPKHFEKRFQGEIKPKHEGRFTKTKSRAMKIYGDLKKVREPASPGGKIASFFNSIFSPRNSKKTLVMEDWNSVRKSRSMKDINATASSCSPLASRSCLSKNPSSKCNKSKRSVRFCPVNIILDEDSQARLGRKIISRDDEYRVSSSMPCVGSQFIKKNIHSFRVQQVKSMSRHEFYENERDVDDDDESCASSDLFELENIGLGVYDDDEELPVYETTSIEMMNKAIC